MNIDDLLNKYFEGETSMEGERYLRTFFASDKVPQRLMIYKPMFAYFDEEIRKKQELRQKQYTVKSNRPFYWLAGMAATILLVLGIRQFVFTPDPCYCSENYVVINGRCYTDIHKVRELALEALGEVAAPASEYFPDREEDALDRKLIENQLKELEDIFSDDE
ncbi:hypothetical protein M2459_002187 [Parabacteroides sp. PF5-5]|uniref:hypothetical protein n=1 Tax=unclassified Parabacteroides TaxID=2649774 RepID=UPI002475CF86|nr:MULTISPECIES: hypothetical protein [unclassified Parabacteroides]MDH6305090.1 hypothetical protein [Parabacteroides sp. PH5-39]MDH6316440.1 hypothetical protein [Parabacteroides sp. PF5-13]MDH6319950.1 hypothetical protein [Parabacteroides sp. PH5-13]MDH6323817.1 hypothetical protein [Parabacteroides sp. PH5-8]MDH6327627.1 hypothetical protein [Parabacteroides sp. PH5-41]